MKHSLNLRTWFLFKVRTDRVLAYLERQSGRPWQPPAGGDAGGSHLHLNVGIPGFEEPADPVEENGEALREAMESGALTLPVVISGEWEVALREGLINEEQLRTHEAALQYAMTA